MKCQLTWLGELNQVSYWFINSNISMIRYQKNWGKWLVNYLVGEGSWFWFFFPRYFQEGQKKKKKGWVMLNCKGHIHAALHLFSLVVDGLTLFWGLPINPVGNIWEIDRHRHIPTNLHLKPSFRCNYLISFDSQVLSCWATNFMGCLSLDDSHHFRLTKGQGVS